MPVSYQESLIRGVADFHYFHHLEKRRSRPYAWTRDSCWCVTVHGCSLSDRDRASKTQGLYCNPRLHSYLARFDAAEALSTYKVDQSKPFKDLQISQSYTVKNIYLNNFELLQSLSPFWEWFWNFWVKAKKSNLRSCGSRTLADVPKEEVTDSLHLKHTTLLIEFCSLHMNGSIWSCWSPAAEQSQSWQET